MQGERSGILGPRSNDFSRPPYQRGAGGLS